MTAKYRLGEYHENIEPVINAIKKEYFVIEVDTSQTTIDYCNVLYDTYCLITQR